MAADYDVGPRPHLPGDPGLRGLQHPGPAERLRAAQPAARHPRPSKRTSAEAQFTVSPFERCTPPDGHLVLQTIRSHDQYNTTFYGLDDRYRGISDGRRVILVHPEDLAELGFRDRDQQYVTDA